MRPHTPPTPASSPFRYFNSSPEVIRLVVMMDVRFPLSLRKLEDLLFQRGGDIWQETVRLWWNRLSPLFAGDIRRQPVSRMRSFRPWRWYDHGRPRIMLLREGQMSDYKGAALILPVLLKTKVLLGDRGYDANWLRQAPAERRIGASKH